MKCPLYNCAQHPELRRTGYSENDPQYVCPVCKTEFYVTEKGLTKDRPFEWPKAKSIKIERWELKKGYWVKGG